MEIDAQVEPLVREALAAVVKQDPERFSRAVNAFPDDVAMTKGVRLATAVALYVLNDQINREPNADEIREIAARVAELESWTDVTAEEVVTFLTAAYRKSRLDSVLAPERIVVLAYVLAADFLSGYSKEGEWWYDYLDRAEAAIDTSTAS